MSGYLVKLISVLIWSAFKYIVGFFIAIGSPPHYNFIETLVYNVGGGMLGVVVYLYVWDFWVTRWRKWRKAEPIEGIKMNRRRRWIVKFVLKYEIIGIVLLTPILLTPPLGTVLAASVEPNKWKIKIYMFAAFTGWTCALYALYVVFGIKLDEVISGLFH